MNRGRKTPLPVVVLILAMAALGVALAQRAEGEGERWNTDQLVTLTGKMTRVERPRPTMVADGKTYTVHLGPVCFWETKGFVLEKGDEVTITGELKQEGEALDLYPHTIQARGETYVLADEEGAPAWSGGWRGCPGPRENCCGRCPHCGGS